MKKAREIKKHIFNLQAAIANELSNIRNPNIFVEES